MEEFFLEASLSGLCKWLRFLGYKAQVAQEKLNLNLIIKNKDKFFLITSPETAEKLEKLGLEYLLLPRDSLKSQLLTLFTKLPLKPELKLNLCTLCGEELIPVKKEDFLDRIPPRVKEKYEEFNFCPRCKKLYWEGDHIKRLKERFRELITPIFKETE